MAELLRIFVSATQDLASERAAIGRALAQLPVQIGMEIRRTPASGAPLETIYEQIANVDRLYFLMGEDISAPAGAEWHLAWKLERRVVALRKRGRHTPAAHEFMRGVPLPWLEFRTAGEAARLVALDVANELAHPANRYGLHVTELELLAAHSARLRAQAIPESSAARRDPGGAQGGGVLLDMGHREPLLGVPLGEDRPEGRGR